MSSAWLTAADRSDNKLGGWYAYRGAKAALNMLVRTASIEVRRKRKQALVVGLHPGTVQTALTEKFAKGKHTHVPDEAAGSLLKVLDALEPEKHTGFLFDYEGKQIEW